MAAEALKIATAFVDARRNGANIAQYPGERPTDLAAAYRIQDLALSIWGRDLGGWKVGRINPPDDARLGANRLAGPVFSDLIFDEGAAVPRFRIFEGGFAAVEAEFMLRLCPQDAPLPQDNADAMNWVDEIRIGIEIASSPYPRINDDGPCVTISDHGNNAGLLLGKAVPRNRWPELNDITVSLDIDGVEAGRATAAGMLDGPFGAVRFLLDNLAQRGIPPQAGWWVSSGAITGVHPIGSGQTASAHFEGIGAISASVASSDG